MYHEKQQFKMLVVLSPIFVADTKMIFGYNFVASLKDSSEEDCVFAGLKKYLACL